MTLESQLNPESKVYMSKKKEDPSKKSVNTTPSAQITIHGPPGVVSFGNLKKYFFLQISFFFVAKQ